MKIRYMVVPTLLVAVFGAGCSKQEQERIGAIPAQSEIRAEQVEAQVLLQQVYSMQESFFAANQRYGASLSEIGVAIPPGARYRYSLNATGSAWRCQATANLDFDPTVDAWVVDQGGAVTCTTDDATS